MSEAKSIEDMAHDYVVASLQAGKAVQREDIEKYCKMAAELKGVAKNVQRDVAEDERRRRWQGGGKIFKIKR